MPSFIILPSTQSLRSVARSRLAIGLYADGAFGSPAIIASCARLSSLRDLP